MFENYTASKTKKLPKWVVLLIMGSIAAHVLVILAMVLHGWWKIEKLALPKGGVVLAISAPPPPPPPAKKGSRTKKPQSDVKKIAKKAPSETTQPVKLDKPLEASTDEQFEGEGDPDGHEDGVSWSDCVGPACDPNSPLAAAPPPPPVKVEKEEPQIVPQVALEAQRLSGDKNILPDDTTKLAIKRDGKTRIVTTVKMCLSAGGTVQRVEMLKSSEYPAYDAAIKSTMRTWRYSPFKVNGKAVPVCTSVTFIYNQRN
ncbi:MAG TPA: TonB family protein [Kofleriaceae bacterium]|nr:TonB family protein [Kofleriaceae bacterium]